MRLSIASSLLLFVTVSLAAQERATLLSVGGDITWAVPIKGHAVGWYFREAQHRVTISARLGNGGGHAYVAAYLMKAIGPGTTEEQEIASTTFDLAFPHDGWTPLFEDLDLEAGAYWLVVAKPSGRAHSSINWFVAQPVERQVSCGGILLLGSRSYTFHGDAADYIPASKFEKKYEPYGFQFEITADAPACATDPH